VKKIKDIKIGPYIYEVYESKDVGNEGNVFGSCHNDDQKIFISPEHKKQKKELTFFHEILHACMFVSGLTYRFKESDASLSPTEEDVVRDMSTVLYQTLKENGGSLKLLDVQEWEE